MDNFRTDLTFKEVDEGWATARLGDVVSFSKGKGISKDDIVEEGKTECIRYGELYTTYSEVIKDVVSKTDIDENELVFSEKNDIIIPSSGETQIDIARASCVLKNGIALGGDINILKTKLNGVYLSYFLNSAKKRDIASMAQGISVVHLYASQLQNLIIHYPLSILHSTKIANCLSSLDDLIAAHSQKLELLKDHKKGLMQNLFPIDNGELTIDNYRTKLSFINVDEGWATARLGDVCEVNPSTREVPDEFNYIDLESVEDGRLLKERKISKENAPSRAQRVLEKNDILFQMVRPYQKNNLYFDKEGVYVASTGYAQIRTNLSSRFFYYLFHTDSFVNEVLKKCTGSNYPAINSSDLSNIIIHYPLSINHSNKIAACLSSLDALITAQAEKIEQLKFHKKGLMQGLFPKIKE